MFEAVKVAVTLPDAARTYGYTPNRSDFIRCPFHQEKTPSMKLYRTAFHCFGCGAHGTVIDFTSMLFGLSPLDAAKKLDADFHLGLSVDRPRDPGDQKKRRQIQEARKHFDEWREEMLDMMGATIRVANMADYEDLTDGEVSAIHYREALEYWSGFLLHGSLADQMEVFRDREGVTTLCRTILKNTPKRLNTA